MLHHIRRTLSVGALVALVWLGSAAGGAAFRPAHAQTVITNTVTAQIKTTDIVRGTVDASFNHAAVVQAIATALQQQDLVEKDPFIKSTLEAAAADPQYLSDTAEAVRLTFGGGDYSATVPLYKVDATAEVIGLVNLQITRPNAETGKAAPTQHDDLRSVINNDLTKNVGSAVLAAKLSAEKPGDATKKLLTDADTQAQNQFDRATNRGQYGDQAQAAKDAVATTTQAVLAQLNPPSPDSGGILMSNGTISR